MTEDMDTHMKFMLEAISEAKKGLDEGGIPIGSVLVRNGVVLSRGHNRRIQDNDPLMHAEINCIKNAGRIGRYSNTVLYSTLMPCYLCAGAVVQFGIPKVVAGESHNFAGAKEFLEEKGVKVINLNLPELRRMMEEYIDTHTDVWYEDIGSL